jgi:hypothetical protein
MTLASENTLRWGVVVAVPLLALLVGVIALPRPQGLIAEQLAFDRSKLGDAVSQMPTKPRRPLDVVPGVVLGGVVAAPADPPKWALDVTTSRRGVVAGVALHEHLASCHPGGQPVAGFTGDGDPASRHRLARVTADAAMHRDLAPLHTRAEPMHAREVTDALDSGIGGIAMNREQVAEWAGSAVGQHGQASDGRGVVSERRRGDECEEQGTHA